MSSTEEKRDVLDVLYGEGGDESGLDEAALGELAKWRELRGVMREVGAKTEQEPPDTMGILMAAARERAPAPKGLWARLRGWLGVMIAHPAMSAAATVVVVGGVAGALYVSGTVGSESRERVAQTTRAEPPPPAGAAAGSGSVAFEHEHAPVELPPAAPPIAEPVPEPAKDTTPAKEKIEIARGGGHRPEKHAPPPAPKTTTGESGGAGRGDDVDGLVAADHAEGNALADRQVASPPPPPPPPPEPAEPAATEETVVVTGKVATPAPAPAPDAASLTRQAKAAAKKKDCKTVDALATRVLQIDERYYRANFASDADIRTNCEAATRR